MTLHIRLPRCRMSRPLPPLPRTMLWAPGSGIPGIEPGTSGTGAPMGLRRIIRGGTVLPLASAGLGDQVIGTGLFTGTRLSPRPRDGPGPGDEPRL